MRIREFDSSDAECLVEILRQNGQYSRAEVEGPAAMERFALCDAALFLVAVEAGRPMGFLRAVYDGSRAIVHLLSVHPACHSRGIGSDLLTAAQTELRRRGAPSLSVTVTEESAGFWEKHGFSRVTGIFNAQGILTILS